MTELSNPLCRLFSSSLGTILTVCRRVELNAVAIGINNDKDPEKILVREAVKNLRKLMSDQGVIFCHLCES